MRDRMAMYNANALKIGVFGANCSSGRAATKVPERWSANWPDCLSLARLADEAGIDFMLPIGRWKGYGGDTDFHGTLALKNITPQTVSPEDYAAKRQYFAANAIGGYPFVGTPDRVAEELADISRAGVRGIAVSFVNYLDELPYFCDAVLPRLARLGLRETR